jgi:uncharacterized protein (DUF1778 family)
VSDMNKRTATISARVTPELEAQIQAIALARDTTVSDLTYQALSDLAARERRAFEQLSRAFGVGQDLPGVPGVPTGAGHE